MPGIDDLPGSRILRIAIPAMAAAGTDDEFEICVAGKNKVVGANWIPTAAVTANGTNYTTISVRNRGAAAAGTALPVSRSYAATNSAAHVAEAMTLSATAADLLLAAGDVITVQRLHTGTGVAVPAGTVELLVQNR